MKIYILRHEDRTMDLTFFSPLTKKGLEKSLKISDELEKLNINSIYSSPYIRTLQTIYPYFITEWTNYTDGGSEDNLTNTVESIDLTPYAGEVIDLRFRFRSGLLGSVGTVDTSYDTGFDGFAFDNITVIKRNTAFGEEQSTSQQVSFQPLAAGEKREISLSAEFIDNKTYYISTTLSNFNGFVDQDPIKIHALLYALITMDHGNMVPLIISR